LLGTYFFIQVEYVLDERRLPNTTLENRKSKFKKKVVKESSNLSNDKDSESADD